MDASGTIRAYYEALETGDPLPPFFHDDDALVKLGISERLAGYEAVAAGLREQSRHTENWQVESRDLRVTERERHAWFTDDVRMAWRDSESRARRDFETRWSGTLERREEWGFVGMHVSVARDLG